MTTSWDPVVQSAAAIADGTITDPKIVSVASTKLVGTIPSAWLGSSGAVAAAGNDPRLTNSRPPLGHGASHAPWQADPAYLDRGDSFQNAYDVLPFGHIWGMHDSLAIVAGTLYLLYFAPDVTRPITQMLVAVSAAFSVQTYLEALLYAVGPGGNGQDSAVSVLMRTGDLSATALTVQAGVGAGTGSNTGMTATGLYTLPFGASYTPVRGTRYAVGVVANASTTMGKLAGHLTTIGASQVGFSTATLGGVANLLFPPVTKLYASGFTAGAPAPPSHTASSGSGNNALFWAALG
jgi:hypothetical protein